jgi:hypothetical protein
VRRGAVRLPRSISVTYTRRFFADYQSPYTSRISLERATAVKLNPMLVAMIARVPYTTLLEYVPVAATIVTTILSVVLARATLRYAKAADHSLEVSREQFEREWAPELHVRLERASTADAKIIITNLARTSVLLQLVQFRTMTHAMPFERQYLNDPLVGGNIWTQHIGDRVLAMTGRDFEGTIAASVSFYAAGRLYRSDWFRFDVEIVRGRFEKVEPVTLPARRVRVLATRQADRFRRQMVKDVVHEPVGAKRENGDLE